MNHKELQERLKELGISIPEGTLTRWVSENLIPGPSPFFKKRERRRGRPKKAAERLQGSRGRFMEWPEETVEAAALVWAVRNSVYLTTTREVSSQSNAKIKQRRVPIPVVKRLQQEGSNLHTLLTTDCKEAVRLLRSCLYPNGFQRNIAVEASSLKGKTLHPLVVLWIAAMEALRHDIPIGKPVSLEYNWTIKEDGQTEFKGMSAQETPVTEMLLEVEHLKPRNDGYSQDYGYPDLDLFDMYGFIDIFTLRPGELEEKFKIRYAAIPSERFLRDDKDPGGYADLLQDIEYGDFL